MKTLFLLSVLFFFSANLFAGDDCSYDKKTNLVTSGDGNTFYCIPTKSATEQGATDFFIRNSKDEDLIYIKMVTFKDPQQIQASNPNGNVFYYEVYFLKDSVVAEMKFIYRNSKVAEFICESKLIKQDKIVKVAEGRFVMVNGSRYSARRREINEANHAPVIINNYPSTPSQPGINIHINR